jgi:hypothetical protein
LTNERLGRTDRERIASLTERCADNDLGGVDARLVVVAERLRIEATARSTAVSWVRSGAKHLEAFTIVLYPGLPHGSTRLGRALCRQ